MIGPNKTILICPWSRQLHSGRPSPKNYPYWPEVVSVLRSSGFKVAHVGSAGEQSIGADHQFEGLPLWALKTLLDGSPGWISVDNFFHHFAAYYQRPGVVIFSKSDPNIFGYDMHTNLLLDRRWLRPDQFNSWGEATYEKASFVDVDAVVDAILKIVVSRY